MPASRSSSRPTRCGQRPCISATPRLTLGSRKRIGSSCAWQSVMCSSDTAPGPLNGGGRSYNAGPACAASASTQRPSAKPATLAIASTCVNSRRLRLMAWPSRPAAGRAWTSLIDRRLRVEQQRHQVAQLVLVEQTHVAEARHVRACGVGLAVVQLAPGVLHDRRRRGVGHVLHAAQLAVIPQARTDGAEGDLLLVDLVAVVAVGAVVLGCGRRIGPGHAAAVLRQLLALAPIA